MYYLVDHNRTYTLYKTRQAADRAMGARRIALTMTADRLRALAGEWNDLAASLEVTDTRPGDD